MKRRSFLQTALAATAAGSISAASKPAVPEFSLRYLMGSCMYGEAPLATVLEACRELNTRHLDIWPRRHGNQREQMDELGHERVHEMLKSSQVTIRSISRFDLGAFQLREEVQVAKKFGVECLVCGTGGPKGLSGPTLKAAIRAFAEKVKPELAYAAEHGVTLTLENHSNTTFNKPDSFGWLLEALEGHPFGVEFAPYHLPQIPALMAKLIRDVGDKLKIFCAWQYGQGCMKPMPKEEELLQLPGRGALDFGPLIQTLREIDYQGYTMIFMHPTPRGIAVMPTVEASTQVIKESMKYLDGFLG